MFKGKSWVLLGFFLSVACVPLMKTIEHSSSECTTLTSKYSVPGGTTPGAYYPYYPSSDYAALPIDPAVTWMTSRDTPLSSAVLFHSNGTLELSGSDQNQNSPRRDIWDTFTDILLPGQAMHLNQSQNQSLISRQKNGNPEIGNVTYPAAALHGIDRILYLRNQTVGKLPDPAAAKKDSKRVKILASTVGILGVLLIIGVTIFFLWRYEKIRQWLWACVRCGSCCRRPKPRCEFKFPGDTPVRTEPEDGGAELQVEERGARCRCAVSCGMSFR